MTLWGAPYQPDTVDFDDRRPNRHASLPIGVVLARSVRDADASYSHPVARPVSCGVCNANRGCQGTSPCDRVLGRARPAMGWAADPMPDPLPRWYASYAGSGPGIVTRDGFVEPYLGTFLGLEREPQLVIMGLNPGYFDPFHRPRRAIRRRDPRRIRLLQRLGSKPPLRPGPVDRRAWTERLLPQPPEPHASPIHVANDDSVSSERSCRSGSTTALVAFCIR